ncbi:hypothetical protein DPX16_10061 [Anabarilius grahami]|uniref:Uncharacterized protein n=1 Tax=Anabarilius grahami TaxID=495550 RepID=A0A3N0XXA1_ANAGA|nr:hypothetical protein DPX16_10061 [Anabarilius grahami]
MTALTGERTIECMESSDQSGVLPDIIAPDVEVNGEKVLHILRKILTEQSNPEELDKAAEVLKRWSKLNGVTTDKKEGSFPQNLPCEYLQEIDQFVENHFPTLPVEGPQGSQLEQLQDFLKNTQSKICYEVLRLTPVLEDAGLLVHLTDSYSRHLFTKLDLLLNRDLSVDQTFCLLLWGKDVFFSPDSQHVFRVYDPLLLTGWFEKAKRKLLPKLKNEISKTLQNILCYDDQHGHNEDSMNEETFIRVHIDVIQCLNAVIENFKAFSKTLMCKAQLLCLKELHRFVQKYVDAEKIHLKKRQPLYLFRIISTCRQLRFYAPQLNNTDIKESDDLFNIIIIMLEEMEDHVLSIVQKMMKHLAQIFENVAYDCVSRVYLDCLMKSKIKRLKKRWENVGEKMKEDALYFLIESNTFKELNGCDDQRNKLLLRMSEVLLCSDVDALKLTCCKLFQELPEDSEQYVPALLRWKGVLSERQLREVLEAIVYPDPNPRCVTRHPLKGLWCCL